MQKEKYYRMRKELVWGAGILAALLLFSTAFGKMEDTADMPQQEEFTPMERKELPAVQSELSDPEDCYLCGTAQESLMGYFRQFDDLGIISVNPWYVLDLGILPHEGDGTDTSGTRTAMTGTGEGGDFFSSSPPVGFPRWKSVMGKIASWMWRRQKLFFARTAWISCSLSWKPTDRKGRNQSPGICAWWIFRRKSCIPCRSSMPATTSGIIMYGWIRRMTGWRWKRSMRQCGIDGKFHGKSGRLPLCYPDRIWYDESILREGSGM